MTFFSSLGEYMSDNSSLKAEVQMYKSSLKELESLNQIIRDEYNANQLALTALEEKLRKTQVLFFWMIVLLSFLIFGVFYLFLLISI